MGRRMGRRAAGAGLLLGSVLLLAGPAGAQVQISGQVDLTALHGSDDRGLNRNFRGDSPFSEIRVRLFYQHWVTDRIGVFAEVLFDKHADVRLNGAYVVVNELAGLEWLGLRAGLAPSLVGSFGLRSTYFNANPLIGVPLVWQHRTTLDGSGLVTTEDLLRRREENAISLPMLYDACWNLQWELLGEAGAFEYSVGMTPGSQSNPSGALAADGIQLLARVGVEPTPGVRLGVSGVIGPYIGGPSRDAEVERTDYPGGPEDYDQRIVGVDAEVSRGRLSVHSEAYRSTWEAPLVTEELIATGGYVEGRYDILPRWLAAVRVGALTFSDVEPDPDTGGGPRGWDDDVLRIESAVTYRWARELHVRAGWQHTEFLTGPEEAENLLALQLRAVF